MTLEYLLEFWNTLLHASVGHVVVSRDMAEKTLQALKRMEDMGALIDFLHEVAGKDLE
jgi:FKBP-type peptidyl-prolyl cis-trans isomerase 2